MSKSLLKVILSISLILPFFFPKTIYAQGADTQCIGKSLAPYMNSVINGVQGLSNIKLLSPVFSASNPDSVGIAKAMAENGANFGALSGIGVNAYNGGGKTITQWASGFKSGSGLPGPMFLTEIGTTDGDINQLASEARKIQQSQDSYIAGLLFNAFNTNNAWSSFSLTDTQITSVCGGTCGKIGVNFATFYGDTDPVKRALAGNGTYSMSFSLEIAKNDSGLVAQKINDLPPGITPVIRIGVGGDSGGFDDPQAYVSFLKEVNSKIGRQAYAIAGPNEPGYESWSSPNCKLSNKDQQGKQKLTISDVPIPNPYVPGDQTRSNEFHALRPYQASPYGTSFGRYVEEAVLFCGNDVVVKQTYNLTPADATSCDAADASGKIKCRFDAPLSGSAKIEIDLKDSELPIVNNTTLVPNRINKANELDDETRMNEYLTWYLGGTVFNAYENPVQDTVANIEKLINFSGPLNKLLPKDVLELQRALTVEVTQLRHNQIYECLLLGKPTSCIGVLDKEARLIPDGDNRVGGTPPTTRSPYIPLAPTEDRAGSVVVPEPQYLNDATKLIQPNIDGVVVDSKSIEFFPDPGITNLNALGPVDGKEVNLSFVAGAPEPSKYTPARDDLYFSGIEETTKLASLLQQTYRSTSLLPEKQGWDGDAGAGPYFRTAIGCEFADAKTGPGDDLFGDYHSAEKGYNTNIKGTLSYKTLPFEVTFEPSKAIKETDIETCKLNCGSNLDCKLQCSATGTTATYEKKVNVYAAMAVYVRSPKLRELVGRLVSGGAGVVQKIFPIDILKNVVYMNDYSAYTKATYKAVGNDPNIEVLAGDAASNVPGSEAKLYFPGLGSVQEYFLRGIQCALRPQGFCEPSSVFLQSTPSTQNACTLSNSGIVSKSLQDLISSAAQWAHIPAQELVILVSQEAGCNDNSPTATFDPTKTPICYASDSDLAPYLNASSPSDPSYQYPRNCKATLTDTTVSRGPMQFQEKFWSPWNEAINRATGANRTTDICNIKDSIYAAAWLLSASYTGCAQTSYADNDPTTPTSICSPITQDSSTCWSLDSVKKSLSAWANGCQGPCVGFGKNYCDLVDEKFDKIKTSCN